MAIKGGPLLLRILSFSCEGSQPSELPWAPCEWVRWSSAVYATAVRAHRSPLPWRPLSVQGRGLERQWRRLALYQRKELALQLFQLAFERVFDDEILDDPWRPAAQRWADVYWGLDGGEVKAEGARFLGRLEDLRAYERARTIFDHPEHIAARADLEGWRATQEEAAGR